MRVRHALLLLALAAPLPAQDDDGIEVSEEKPAAPRTIEACVTSNLAWLRSAQGQVPGQSQSRALEAFVLYTRAVCKDLRKEDRQKLDAWCDAWKRDSGHRDYANPIDVAAVILALVAANTDPGAKPPAMSDNPNRPPRGSRFDKDHWRLMHACIEFLTKDLPMRQDTIGGAWGAGTEDPLVTTHFVLLALREAGRAGYPVEAGVFEKALHYLNERGTHSGVYRDQNSFGPNAEDHARGMVSVWICRERLALAADPKYPVRESSRALAERTAALDQVFKDDKKPPTIECLWLMEQLGSMTGRAELGGRNWYREGTSRILASTGGDRPDTQEQLFAVCYTLLFLNRPTAPLAAGK